MRRAFTLMEVVFSLALLGTLAVACASWTVGSLRVQQRTITDSEHRRHIETLERLIRVDLFNIDVTLPATQRREERIWVAENTLHILTRDRGAAEVVYRFAPTENVIVRTRRPIGSDDLPSDVLLVSDAAGLQISLQPAVRDDRWAVLVIGIRRSGNERPDSFEFVVPAEWTP